MHIFFILFIVVFFLTSCTPAPKTLLKDKSIIVSDNLSFESYKDFLQIIKSNSVDTVIFKDCFGGNVYVGLQYAKIIRSYRLNTVASGFVGSACAGAFLGGVARTLDGNATWNVIMFHGGLETKTKQSAGVKLNQLLLDEFSRELNFRFSYQVNDIILNTKKEEEGIYFFSNNKGINLTLYCDGNQGKDYLKCKQLNEISLKSEKIVF